MPGGKSRKSGGISKELIHAIAMEAKNKLGTKKGKSCGSTSKNNQHKGPSFNVFGNSPDEREEA